MNQRYGEHNGESQQYGQEGRFGQTDRDREGRDRDDYRASQSGWERHDERHMGRDEGPRSRNYGRGGYGEDRYARDPYSGRGFGEGSDTDRERSAYFGAMSYRDQDPWRGESGRPFYGRREESGYGGMRRGYAGDWESGQGTYGSGRFGQEGQRSWGQQGPESGRGLYGEERFGERRWESGRERGGGRGLLGRLFGRGPKGYKRSDERIREEICERLWRSASVDSSEVTITVKEGEVSLTGTVPERWMRHEIEDIADDCMGVKDVNNNIRIQRQTEEAGTESTSASRGTAASGTKQ